MTPSEVRSLEAIHYNNPGNFRRPKPTETHERLFPIHLGDPQDASSTQEQAHYLREIHSHQQAHYRRSSLLHSPPGTLAAASSRFLVLPQANRGKEGEKRGGDHREAWRQPPGGGGRRGVHRAEGAEAATRRHGGGHREAGRRAEGTETATGRRGGGRRERCGEAANGRLPGGGREAGRRKT
ncbi:hypothetical protein GUJ93_ZPchr0005g15731 [Zizania palustris]|uniref:Uncharacterized protein n=1 Tax=Zizania palustris TaxID=103762 RepID=A0A8J5W1W9_ZIZPA|nr:hypothetical protein GUJ93_ZPchr0005g15731 [Zizania palustris]